MYLEMIYNRLRETSKLVFLIRAQVVIEHYYWHCAATGFMLFTLDRLCRNVERLLPARLRHQEVDRAHFVHCRNIPSLKVFARVRLGRIQALHSWRQRFKR